MKKLLTIIATLVVASFSLTGQRLPHHIEKIMNAVYGVSTLYVDSVDEEKLVEDAIKGMLEKLDPHSTYTDPKETKEATEPLQGEFEGIGIQFNMKEDTLYVIQTIPNGPSERVGIMAGDRIVTVNDTTIAGVKMARRDIMKRLRGKKGTSVTVQVKRRGAKELITFRITRDKIPLHTVDASYMLDDRTGYVRISSFGAKTHDEVMEALDKLTRQGMKQLVIDLSDNGGGYLQAAVDLCNEFLDAGQLIVYTEGRATPRSEAYAQGNGRYRDLKLAVVVNQFSASAAEIFSGAMQDWDRAVLVGRRTFGKGLVQRPLTYSDGSMIRLTVAHYYTPSGRCIQKPYEKGNRKAYSDDLLDRERKGEYFHLDSIHLPDSLRYQTLLQHRPVYGGGGVMPDIYVPIDTSEYSTYYRDLMAKGIINQFVVNYVDRHRDALKRQYADVRDFDNRFEVTEADMAEFIALGEKDSVHYDEAKYRTSERVFRTMIKGMIARDVFADPGAYSVVVNHRNHEVKAALDVLNDDQRFDLLLREGNRDYERLVTKK
ncbi:MAG: S41 family peptidase [Muribaculaceae bacterium]|nr:S41 family peptidase [Muribaculaceae bacterium]